MKTAMHSVFIAKENVLWLEEWIDYHSQLGFDEFYLYDNSKVQTKGWWERRTKNEYIKPGRVNKYGWDFKQEVPLNKKQIDLILKDISDKYPGVHFVEWAPLDEYGKVKYAQARAHAHCARKLKRKGVDWCASLDMDEFLVIDQGRKNDIKEYLSGLSDKKALVRIRQIKFESRNRNSDKLITEISKSMRHYKSDGFRKYIYKPSMTTDFRVHKAMTVAGGEWYNPQIEELGVNHYKLNEEEGSLKLKTFNINSKILKSLQLNKKNYIINEYIK